MTLTRLLLLLLLGVSSACKTHCVNPMSVFDERLLNTWDWSDVAGNVNRFQSVLAEPDLSAQERVLTMAQLARAQGLSGRYADAHSTLDAARGMEVSAPLCRARVQLERGRVLRSSGNAAAAIPVFEEAWRVACGADLEHVAGDALHMLALTTKGAVADDWMTRGIAYCDAAVDPRARKWLGPLLHNAWYARLEAGHWGEALDFAERARSHRAAMKDAAGERIARWTIYHTHRKAGRISVALKGFEGLLADYGESGDPSGYTDEELGECLLAMGQAARSAPHFQRAWERLSNDTALAESEPARLERLRRLGR